MSFDASLQDRYYVDSDESADGDGASAEDRRSTIGYHTVLAAAVVLAWMFSLNGGFVWLDHVEIENGGYRVLDNEDLHRVWTLSLDNYLDRREGPPSAGVVGGYWRPLHALSVSLDWNLWQDRAWAYHAENIVWHLIAVCGLFALGTHLLRHSPDARPIAFWATLLFAVHPLGVHSVTWISGRKDLLCTVFSVFALLAFARLALADKQSAIGPVRVILWSLVSAVALAAALAAKELAFVVPVFATGWLLAELWYSRGSDHFRVPLWPAACGLVSLWAIAGLALWWRWKFLGGIGLGVDYPSDSLWANVATSSRLAWYYLGQGLAPIDTTIVDHWEVSQAIGALDIAAMLGVVAIAVVLSLAVYRRYLPATIVLWYVVWMLPASGIMPLRHLRADRYLYPAVWGLSLLVAWLISHAVTSVSESVRLRHAMFAVLAMALCFVTWGEIPHWKSDEALFSHAVKQDPAYVEGQLGLAALALEEGDYRLAVKHSQKAIESATSPGQSSYWSPFVTHTNLGLAHYHLGEFDEAGLQFERAAMSRPKNSLAQYHLGLNALANQDLKTAERYFRQSLQFDSDDYLARSNLAYVLLRTGRLSECLPMFNGLVQEQPHDLTNRANYGSACLLASQFAEAEQQFEVLVGAQPRVALHRAKLAWAQWKLGKTEQAVQQLTVAKALSPKLPAVRNVALMILKNRSQLGGTQNFAPDAANEPPNASRNPKGEQDDSANR